MLSRKPPRNRLLHLTQPRPTTQHLEWTQSNKAGFRPRRVHARRSPYVTRNLDGKAKDLEAYRSVTKTIGGVAFWSPPTRRDFEIRDPHFLRPFSSQLNSFTAMTPSYSSNGCTSSQAWDPRNLSAEEKGRPARFYYKR